MIKFNYDNPEDFLKELDIRLSFPIQEKKFLFTPAQKISSEKIFSKEELKKEFDTFGGYEALMQYKQKKILEIEIKGKKIRSLVSKT